MIDINELRSMVNAAHFESFANSVINALLNRIEEAESALSNLGVTPDEARDGLARHKATLARLEAAEKERDDLRAEVQTWQGQAKAYWSKIEAMERQEPVAWMSSRNGFICKENKNPDYNMPLYLTPGAKGE